MKLKFQYKEWQKRRLSVVPGLTGPWQVSGRNKVNHFNDWVKLDLDYIDITGKMLVKNIYNLYEPLFNKLLPMTNESDICFLPIESCNCHKKYVFSSFL